MPSRSDWSPSATTCSPGLSPSSMIQSVSTRGPTLTLRNATFLSAPTTATLYRFCSSCTARCGTMSAPALVSSSSRARPYWPGRRTLSGLGKYSCTPSVPVALLTARSTGPIVPVCRCVAPSARVSSMPDTLPLLPCPRRIALDDAEVVGLGDGDAEDDRVDRRDGRQERALASSDEAARLHLRRADQPANRRGDPDVAEIEGGFVDRRLGGLDLRPHGVLRRSRVVELPLADRLFGDERHVPGHVVVGLREPRPGGRQFGVRLRERGLERLRVDLIEKVASADERPFAEVHRVEEAFHPRADVDILESLGLSDQVQVHRHVLLNDGRHVDFRRLWRNGDRLLARRTQRRRHRHGDKHRSSNALHAHVLPFVREGPRAAAMPSGPAVRRARRVRDRKQICRGRWIVDESEHGPPMTGALSGRSASELSEHRGAPAAVVLPDQRALAGAVDSGARGTPRAPSMAVVDS